MVWVLLRPTKTSKVNELGDGNYGFSCSSKKIRKSNCLKMSLQRQHFLLSYLTSLSVGLARVWTCDLPQSRPVLSQLSLPGSTFNYLCQHIPVKRGVEHWKGWWENGLRSYVTVITWFVKLACLSKKRVCIFILGFSIY